jgi:hypothetical protein
MRVSIEGVLSGIGVVALLGPVISVVIRQVQGPVVRPFDVDGLSVQCLGDSRGIRVVCDDEVIFAAKGALLKSARSEVRGRVLVVRYWAGLPRLAIFVDGRKVTSWPFPRSEWWARFFAVGWPVFWIVAGFVVWRLAPVIK